MQSTAHRTSINSNSIFQYGIVKILISKNFFATQRIAYFIDRLFRNKGPFIISCSAR
ncbi:hypothetical protein BVI434_430007 [Burkholderia vietnamiensis]|nr:hypothetical protein BVI434_430007 [Burkholderia vietnamiensis]